MLLQMSLDCCWRMFWWVVEEVRGDVKIDEAGDGGNVGKGFKRTD